MEILKARAVLTNLVRKFFTKKDYLEVCTPVLGSRLIPEACLEVFRTGYYSPDGQKKNYYLIPSPEIWMKKLLAEGSGSIFQITKSFRNTEPADRLHNPEFTMLEWYTVKKDYKYSILTMQELINYIKSNFNLKDRVNKLFEKDIKTVSMKELFLEMLNINLDEVQALSAIKSKARSLGITASSDDTWESLFNKMFLNFIEPELHGAVIIYDYPDKIPCLAKSRGFYSERWELYINGIEIANCYSEETDKEKIKNFFKNQTKLKEKSLVKHPADESFIELFGSGFPECTGAALGMDRLFMVLLNINTIDGVITFPFQ
jgi:lysyl-tRNA synthetase class 2